MTHITVYSALVLLALTLCSHAQTLGKIDCHAVNIMGIDGNSHVFDFTALQDSTSTPIIVNDSRTSDTYQLSMFNNFNCNGNPAAVCQQSSNGSSPCGVGFATFTVADWIPIDTLYPYGAVRFRLNPTGIPARYSTITIVCDMIATTSDHSAPTNVTVVSHTDIPQPFLYEVSFFHRSVCINDGGLSAYPFASASLTLMSALFTISLLLLSF